MWILKPLDSGGETHYLLPTKVYVVGRKNCDILLSNDQSISRAHAHLTADEQTLTVKDCSKYGTFVNDSRVPENGALSLKSGDNITFGVFHSKFSVEHQEVVVCSSCLDNSEKKLLSDALQPLGGRLVNSWTQDCTHLVMSSVKVTIKTICALLCGRLIVRREYFTEFSAALRQRLPPPQAERFVPEIDEPSLNKDEVDLGINPERGRLFLRKTFVFFNSKQLKRLSAAVSFGGGESQLLEEGSLPRPLLESPHSCVVDVASGSSQPLLPCSTTEWVDSVKRIVHESGCRLVTESEIGLAAISVSCEKYCNPSIAFSDSDSVQSVNPTLLPNPSLSQNVAVEETMLPGPSVNITTYVGNTESSQRRGTLGAAGPETVRETPKKSQRGGSGPPGGSGPGAQEAGDVSAVAAVMGAGSRRPKPGFEPSGAKNGGVLPPIQMVNTGVGTLSQKRPSQKQKVGSPQKQTTLASFFQPVNHKRPREDELSAVESEPKRASQPRISSAATPAPCAALPREHAAAAEAQCLSGSELDLFVEPAVAPLAGGVSQPPQQGSQGRKRKEPEEEAEAKADDINMEELESIMSLEMEFGEPSWAQRAPLAENRSVGKMKPASACASAAAGERSSASKRPRVDPGEPAGAGPAPGAGGPPKVSTSVAATAVAASRGVANGRQRQPPATSGHAADEPGPRRGPAEGPAGSGGREALEVKDEDVSIVVGPSEALGGAARGQPMEMLEKPLKVIKRDATASEAEEDLPKRLVLVEFKSLTVTAPPRGKPQAVQGPSLTKNFKCFRKVRRSGTEGIPWVIGGGDLLAHSRGKNAELDEWLKDAAEEERQSKQDESLGDDLFRYNPAKLSKRR